MWVISLTQGIAQAIKRFKALSRLEVVRRLPMVHRLRRPLQKELVMNHLCCRIFEGLAILAAAAGPALADSGADSASQPITPAGLVMLIPGVIVAACVLGLLVTAPFWRHRHLHHW
jgi:hypothetical protein